MDVGEAVVAPGVVKGEALVVDAEEMEDGGVEVVDGDLVTYCVVAVVICRSVVVAGPGSSSAHPHCESVWIVIAAVVAASHLAIKKFAAGRAAEFTAAQDEGVLQKAPRLEVVKEGRNGLIHRMGIPTMALF